MYRMHLPTYVLPENSRIFHENSFVGRASFSGGSLGEETVIVHEDTKILASVGPY